MTNIIKNLSEQEKNFNKNMDKIVKKLIKYMDAAVMGLPRDGDVANITPEAIISISTELDKALEKTGYNKAIRKTLLESKKNLSETMGRIEALIGDGKRVFGKIDKRTINSLLEMGYKGIETVPEQIKQKLIQNVYQGAIIGKNIKTLVEETEAILEQLPYRTETQINTFKREFIQKGEENIAKQIGFGESDNDIWEYVGAPLQDNSHPECVWAIDKQYFTTEEKEEFQNGGGFTHSEPRWNCQHIFQITNMTYEEAFGNKKET